MPAERGQRVERESLADYALFDRLEEGLGDAPALRFGARGYSYREVAERARALAAYLARVGVRPEERVYLVLPDAPPFAWAFFGALACGGVVVMGNPRAAAEELAHVIEYARPSAVIATPEAARAMAAPLRAQPGVRAVLLVPDAPTGHDPEAPATVPGPVTDAPYEAWPLADALARGRAAPRAPLPAVRRDDPAIWLLTSGSSGRPKAAVHAHRDLIEHSEAYAIRTVGYRAGDVTISVPRLSFGYATGTNLVFPFAAGATVGLYSEPPTPESVARAASRYGATIVTNVPTMLAKLLERDAALAASGRPGLELGGARFHISAGEALPPRLRERFESRFSVPVYDGIGSAETFHIYATNRPGDVRPGSLGRAVDGFELAILPESARGPGAEELPRGEAGVLWVRGPSVAMGYARDRDASAATFFGAWCRTGDVCRLDAEGYLYYQGRADALFKVGGVWVAPAEVEACLAEHDAVAEAAVLPFERDGLLVPEARVVPSGRAEARLASPAARGALAEELRAHVRARLGAQRQPRRIEFVEDLPRTERGKLDRVALARGAP